MGFEKKRSRVRVRGHALQKCQYVACLIGCLTIEEWRRQEWIHGHNFLEKRCNRADRVPDKRRQFRKVLALPRELEQGIIAFLCILQLVDMLDNILLLMFRNTRVDHELACEAITIVTKNKCEIFVNYLR